MKMDDVSADVSLFNHINQLTARKETTYNKGNMYPPLLKRRKDRGNLKSNGWRNINNGYRCDKGSWIVS